MRSDHPTPAQRPGLEALWAQAFGDPAEFIRDFFETAYDPGRCLCVTEGEKVLAALYWFDCAWEGRPVAYIYAVATAEAARGRGLCRGLMERCLALLRARGYSGALLAPAGEALFRMYEKMGFVCPLTIREFPALAGPTPARVTAIEPAEYAALRREALPEGGVVQEGENLAFLSRFARFYRGEGCFFAASMEETHLFSMEFFGDETQIPGILKALGAETGTFRTPGNDRPFALYAPLTHAPAPQYFALSFE